jgi:hypothetical protein
MSLPIAEGQFDVHALVKGDDVSGRELCFRASGEQQEPRLLKGRVVEDDNIHGLLRRILIRGVGVTLRAPATVAEAAEAEALALHADHGVAAAANQEGDVQRAEVRE